MPETTTSARRIGPLDLPEPAIDCAALRIRVLPAAARFVLRLPQAEAARVARASGLALDLPVNRASVTGSTMAARLGPDEWLLLAPIEREAAIRSELEAVLGGAHHALVAIGHRQGALEISGAAAPAVLASGCPLDLSDRNFPPGSATRSLLGKSEIVLLRTADEAAGVSTFRLECGRSFLRYVHDFLVTAGRIYA